MRRPLVLLVLLGLTVACSDSNPATPSASVTEPPTSTSTPSVEDEVEAAYLRSWEVYAKAVRELDPSGLEESYASPQLERTRADVAAREADGRPARIDVEHDYEVIELNGDTALVVDRYLNHSVLMDPSTSKPAEPDPNEKIVEKYTLRKIGDRWRVVDIARS